MQALAQRDGNFRRLSGASVTTSVDAQEGHEVNRGVGAK
jgi:hypothetical protein